MAGSLADFDVGAGVPFGALRHLFELVAVAHEATLESGKQLLAVRLITVRQLGDWR